MSLISVRDLVVQYDGRRVLDGLNLDIEPGQITVLLGGSGSGKSTLLRQILGLEHPKSGSISIKGIDITTCSPADLKAIRRSVGVAFQSAALFNSLTLEDNVALTLREHTALAPSVIDLIVWLKLAVVGLADFGKLHPQELSGGMKKRAAGRTIGQTRPRHRHDAHRLIGRLHHRRHDSGHHRRRSRRPTCDSPRPRHAGPRSPRGRTFFRSRAETKTRSYGAPPRDCPASTRRLSPICLL